MSGTSRGGLKAAKTNKTKYGKDFYKKIGALGGANGRTGGFGHPVFGKELARRAGAKGGKISRRGPGKKRSVAEEMGDRFLILGREADQATIEPFSKEPFWKGWFK